jgi:hypothetical protein
MYEESKQIKGKLPYLKSDVGATEKDADKRPEPSVD